MWLGTLFTCNSEGLRGPMGLNEEDQGVMEVCPTWGSHLLAPSLPGGGGVLLPDPRHVGVLFPLCPASKCLSGGISGLPPEPSAGQYSLKGPLGLPKPMPSWKLWSFSQGVGMGWEWGGVWSQSRGTGMWTNSPGLRNHREVGHAGGREDSW